jgi:dihydrofolate synthase / folylpolyglutamate synthase
MDYQQAILYIEELALIEQKRPSLPSLERIQAFLAYYNSPQDSFTSFHVAGTNGKGSTVAILDSILRQSQFKVGRFTGPHILRFNERFHVNGQPIADEELATLVSEVKQKSEKFASSHPELGALSWFEFLTVLAFFYFAQSGVDIAVIEVGLGGRFDATNVLTKLYATGITNIGLDHQKILGSTIEEIAMEKAGIIKASVPIVTAASEPALSVITKRATEMNAKLTDSNEQNMERSNKYAKILTALSKIKNDLNHHGLYQYQNALTALCMLTESGLLSFDTTNGTKSKTANNQITLESGLKGLQDFYWPGRFQLIESEQIILDGAHNPAGIKALRESLDYLYPGEHFHFIFACYHDKDGFTMLSNLLKPGDRLYLVDLLAKRSFFSLTALAEHASTLGVEVDIFSDVQQGLTSAKTHRNKEQPIVATGSFFLLKELTQLLGWTTVEDRTN